MALDQDHMITWYTLTRMRIEKSYSERKKYGTKIKKNIERMQNKENN